jgi:hypothetical protein|tara:strand:+ start:75 stop:491 length:417 start_codon:yes stop_codon:yes gene_type:complete
MVKVKVVYINGKETEYNVEYPKAYIAKIMESENGLMLDQKSVKEIYKEDKLIAKFTNGFLNELELEKPEPKKRSKSTQEAIADQQDINRKLKDKIKADEDWNEYQADILHAQKMLKENIWVTDHTGGNVDLNYIPKSL